jgi:hypothetical protein
MDNNNLQVNIGGNNAWVVSVQMGLGHMRAANPLKDIANNGILVDGSREFCSPHEYALWKRIRQAYYFLSRAEEFPLVGKYLLKGLLAVEQIPAYYPTRDLSSPDAAVKYLSTVIRKQGLCDTLIKTITNDTRPLINTFYATAIAVDLMEKSSRDNYLVICDSDFNRIWVPEKPGQSRIKYIAPCTWVEKRLLAYGVPAERIFLTGFPLPKENLGSQARLEILKQDLFNRLLRLDPYHRFFNFHRKSVEYFLEQEVPPVKVSDCLTITFAVGGAGAQAGMVEKILKSLAGKIQQGRVKLNLVAGIRQEVYDRFVTYIEEAQLSSCIGNGLEVVYDPDIYGYFTKFNRLLRSTDVLWTKPSELTFYCALGLPILLAPSVGSHEELNRKWLQDHHAGVKPLGPLENVDEWIFDLRDSGIFAEAAWDGFLKGRKLGTFRIEELIRTGHCVYGATPLER